MRSPHTGGTTFDFCLWLCFFYPLPQQDAEAGLDFVRSKYLFGPNYVSFSDVKILKRNCRMVKIFMLLPFFAESYTLIQI